MERLPQNVIPMVIESSSQGGASFRYLLIAAKRTNYISGNAYK